MKEPAKAKVLGPLKLTQLIALETAGFAEVEAG